MWLAGGFVAKPWVSVFSSVVLNQFSETLKQNSVSQRSIFYNRTLYYIIYLECYKIELLATAPFYVSLNKGDSFF